MYTDVSFLQTELPMDLNSSVNPSVIFSLWSNKRPFSLSLSLSLSSFFSATNTTTPKLYHKSTSHYKSSHPDTQFINSLLWFKFYWGFPNSSKQNYPFLFELDFKILILLHIFVVYVFYLHTSYFKNIHYIFLHTSQSHLDCKCYSCHQRLLSTWHNIIHMMCWMKW